MPHGEHIERYHGGWTGGGTLSSRGVFADPYYARPYGPYGAYGYGVGGYGISSGFLLPGELGYGGYPPRIYGAGIYANPQTVVVSGVETPVEPTSTKDKNKKIAIFVGIVCAIFFLLFLILAIVLSKRR